MPPQESQGDTMGQLGGRRLRQIQHERFGDLLSDSLRRVSKGAKVIYVDSNTGSNNYNGLRIESPVATVKYATSLLTAGKGDQIFVLPNHMEEVTSAITLVDDSAIKGLTFGNRRPFLAVNGAINLIDVAGAGCSVTGLSLTISTTDAALSLINVSKEKAYISDIKMIPSDTGINVVDCIVVANGADDLHLDNIQIFNTTVAVNSFLSITASVNRMKMTNCHFSGDTATGGIIDSAAAANIFWKDNVVRVIGTNQPAVTLDSNPTGVVINFHALGTDATIANNANWGNALILSQIYTRGGTGTTAQATTIIPALDT